MHPGESLAEDFLAELKISPAELADRTEISLDHIEALIAEEADFSIDDAVRIADALETRPDFWINLQIRYNQWFASQPAAVAN